MLIFASANKIYKIMGEYADMEIERGFSEYFNQRQGIGIYNPEHEDYIEEWCGEEVPSHIEQWTSFEFNNIERETPKSWLLNMMGGNRQWFSKKYCKLVHNRILLPQWYCDMLT